MPDKIRVTAIQRLCVNDGPGVRTVIFLKGCYLECPWCCNPESIHYNRDDFFVKGTCKYPSKNSICSGCELNGGNVKKGQCPFGSFIKTYSDYTVEELFHFLIRDKALYQDGGVTFSGGEPLLQSEAILPLLRLLKENSVHVAFETTLFAPSWQYNMVRDYVDYWIVDLKFQYGYITNRDYALDIRDFMKNLHDLQYNRNPVIYRMVIMEEILYKKDNIIRQFKEHHICQVELLAFHSLAKYKYEELQKNFHLFKPPSQEQIRDMCNYLIGNGIKACSLSL